MAHTFLRQFSALSVFGLATLGLVALAAPAGAAPPFTGNCGTSTPAATLVANNLCEVRFTSGGTHTFTPPSDATKVAAILVGGGGGSIEAPSAAFAGGGGGVSYVDSVPLGAAITVSVGAGGAAGGLDDSAAQPGGDTSIPGFASAKGGYAGAYEDSNSGKSGSGNASATCHDAGSVLTAGGGAASAASSAVGEGICAMPGDGYAPSAVPGADTTLFPSVADEATLLGVGGEAYLSVQDSPVRFAPEVENFYGAGADAMTGSDGGDHGEDGAAIFRWSAITAPTSTPTPTPTATPTSTPTSTPSATSSLTPGATVSSPSVAPGGSVTVTGTGFAAGEVVDVYLHSTPVLVGSPTATGGSFSLPVTIPSNTASGAHEFVLIGRTSGATASVGITVTATLALVNTGGVASAASAASSTMVVVWASLAGLGALLLAAAGITFARRRSN